MQTFNDVVKSKNIRIKSERVDHNPNMADSENMDHWRSVLKIENRQMTVYFSKGYGHKGQEPGASEVLECLASDSAGVENSTSFEDWAADLGYDPDSRKAEKIFKVCEKQAEDLKRFLGPDLYESVLWDTEA